MVNVPIEIRNDVFERELNIGCVILKFYSFDNGVQRKKYFILINEPASDLLIFLVTTSQIDFFNNHPQFNSDVIRLRAGELSFLPEETVIDCTRTFEMEREKIKKEYQEGMLSFVGELPPEYLLQVNNTLRNSRLLSKDAKKLIFGA